MKHIIFSSLLELSHLTEWWQKSRLSRRIEWWGKESSIRRLIFNWNVVELQRTLSSLRSEAASFIIIVKSKNRRWEGEMKRNRRPGKRNVIEDLEKSDSRPKSFFRSRHRSTNYEIIVLMDDIELVGYYKDCAMVGIYPLLSIREGMGFHSKNKRSSRHLVPFSLLLFLQRRFSSKRKARITEDWIISRREWR